MGMLEVDGAQLVYEVGGQGRQALAFVHGWCSMSAHWDAQWDAFGSTHRMVRWDRRGMGGSITHRPAGSPSRHAEDLAAVLDGEGIDRVTVVGHAGGGPTALTFAERFADRTEALVLVDIRLHAGSAAPAEDRFAAGVEQLISRLSSEERDVVLARSYRSYFGPRAGAATVDAAVGNALRTGPDVAVAELRHVLGDTFGLAGRVRCPVLWVSVQPEDTAMVRRAFADVAIGHVVGSGHFVQLEVPEQLNAMIDAFLTARVAGTARPSPVAAPDRG
jgi:pimeloyl-ACP methyl ester carboxylesterase